MEQFRPVLGHVDGEVLDFELHELRDGRLLVADEASPYALLDRTLELRGGATAIRELAPAVEKQSIKQLQQRIRDDEQVRFEVILESSAADSIRSHPNYDSISQFEDDTDRVDQYVYPGEFPLFVAVIDETTLLGVTVDGQPSAMIETTADEIRAWANRTIDEFRAESTPFEQFQRISADRPK